MRVYEEVIDFGKLKTHLVDQLEKYNNTPKTIKMNIVLFKDAVIHITRIYRVLTTKRGHCMLVGVGGSGRHSLTRLAAFVANMTSTHLDIRANFKLKDFRAALKTMYEGCSHLIKDERRRKTVFIFSDNDVAEETFLEDIQNMLNGGVVPNLYPNEELSRVRDEMKNAYKLADQTNEAPDVMNEWFFN